MSDPEATQLVVEAYGTVTPPPEPTTTDEEGGN